MAEREALTHDRLCEVLRYDPLTGEWTWLKTLSRRAVAGTTAGWKCHRLGYRSIGIDGKGYLAHRLAVFYITGFWPEHTVDHIHGDPSDNRWAQIREATRSQNQCNRRLGINNTSGVKGVYFDGRRNKWRVEIIKDKRRFRFGRFDCFEEASLVAKRAYANLHGVFAKPA